MPASRRPPRKSKAKEKSPKPVAEKPRTPAEENPPQQEPNGVLVVREYVENGDLNTGIQRLGDVKIGEVLTILEVALKSTRAQLGLD